MAVRTWVGRFGIAQGQALEMGPWQGAFARRRPDEDPADLYVLVEPALPGSEEFCGQLVAVIGRLFEQRGVSLTGALTKAISAAHENLREWNRKSLREHQVGAGLSCLVVREDVAYLAQAGPALAYYRSGDVLRRVAPQDPQATAVVGLGEELQPELTRYELSPGDILLVASPSLSEIADGEAIDALLSGDAEQALSELYLLTRDQEDFSLFLLNCYAEPEVAEEAQEAEIEIVEPPLESAEMAEEPAIPFEEAGEAPIPEDYEDEDERQPRLFSSLEPAAAAASPADISRPLVRLRSSQPNLRRYARTTTSGRVPGIPWWLPAIALFLGLVALLGWCTIPSSMQENKEERFASLLAEARESYDAALPLSDLSEKRSLLEEADSQLAEAADIHPDDADLQALRLEVAAALAEMAAVYEVTDLRLLADLRTQMTGDLSLQRLVVGEGGAYLLDHKGGRIIGLPLSQPEAKAAVILSEGDLVGVVKTGRPVQIAWSPDVDGGKLLILDSERHLFSYHPAKGMGLLTLRGAEEWKSLDGLAAYNGNLYVLDSKANQVWRYLPTEGGFDSERTGVLSTADLTGAIGLTVSGDIYMLTERGGIRRFSGGQEVAFGMDGIDQPLVSPASLVPVGEQGLLIADRGNKRIVVFTLDGRFQRQLVSGSLTDLQAVAADEVAGSLYVLNGDSLYVAGLPPGQEGAPGQEATPPAGQEEVAP